MSGFNASSGLSLAGGSASGATGFTVTEIALPGTANTEFSHVIPSSAKYVWIKTKGTKRLEIYHVSAGTDRWKLKGGEKFFSPELTLSGTLTVYMSSPDVGDTVEIITWS